MGSSDEQLDHKQGGRCGPSIPQLGQYMVNSCDGQEIYRSRYRTIATSDHALSKVLNIFNTRRYRTRITSGPIHPLTCDECDALHGDYTVLYYTVLYCTVMHFTVVAVFTLKGVPISYRESDANTFRDC